MTTRYALIASMLVLSCAQPGGLRGPTGGGPQPLSAYPPRDLQRRAPLTRAERSNFTETSTHADVMAFVDSLRGRSPDIHVGTFGRTGEGKELPLIVLSRPAVRTVEEARRLNRPIVHLQGNIHGGEVEGKEALLAVARDLVQDRYQNVLDSLVILIVPIYNADGNDALGPQVRNRRAQQGPPLIGQRANAQGLDLNRDYMKAEAPETRASLAFFRTWDPDVFVDLHTTNGSYHGYALTWAPPLNPAAIFTGAFTSDTLLPALAETLRRTLRIQTYPYGNFVSQDSAARGWFTYDHRPRFGTNYQGLRGRIGILSEAYSHDPFEQRVASTYGFVMELLSLVAANAMDIMEAGRDADRRTTAFAFSADASPEIAIRSRITTKPRMDEVLVEEIVRTGDTVRYEAGMPPGVRRTGKVRAVEMPVYDRFEPTLTQTIPYAWSFPRELSALVEPLRRHGVFVEQLNVAARVASQRFIIDTIARAQRPFQGHEEVRLEGRWEPDSVTLDSAAYVVRGAQPLGILALYLLDPRSDDGLVTWNFLDQWLAPASPFPIRRVIGRITVPLRPVP